MRYQNIITTHLYISAHVVFLIQKQLIRLMYSIKLIWRN